ncbi:MAG: nuclear transport factor 2 family protein [Candidatus Kapabacteria bacterium]|nr:nuclear transport factor 2 family protein [Ignavibacteriota bacterium]MCW5884648.1 nuclear transport factor 2 family protein [Candidatus Kapabacteria bacterium]
MNNPHWIDDLSASIDSMDTAKFVSFMTDDAVLTFGNAPAVAGKDNIFQVIDGFFKSIKKLVHHDYITIQEANKVVVPGTVTYTRHDDTILSVGFCNVFTMKDNLISEYRIYVDISQLYI